MKAVWIIGSNPVATMPRRSGVIDGLNAADLVIVQDVYHPTETTRYADILLPRAVWAEAEGIMVNSERNVTLMQKAVDPPGEACADWDIIARMAREMGYADGFRYQDASEIFDEIRQTANPKTGYDLRGMSYERLRQGAMQWPRGPGEETGRPIRYVETDPTEPVSESPRAQTLKFPTETGKARFFARPHLPPAELPDAEFPLILITGRCAHQWHTMTKTGKSPALNKLNPRPFLEIHPEDADLLEIAEGDPVEVRSRRGRAIYPARVTPRIRQGSCFAPFHWNDLFGKDLAINAATSESLDPISKQPEFKFCAVRVSKVPAAAAPEPSDLEPAETSKSSERFSQEGPLTQEQKEYIQGFVAGLIASGPVPPGLAYGLPKNSPFSAPQRAWTNGLLAAALTGAREPGAPPARPTPTTRQNAARR